tara:strand:+ start:123 stop:1097 length:975 start_codon:yes stop_codon:yes gene_type:complete
MIKTMTAGFYSLCYHYIRNDYDDPLPRLFGTKISDFNEHVSMLKKEYNVISLNDVNSFYSLETNFKDIKNGLLITFDDGLSDQFEAGKILAENDISSIFFIPTCTIKDNLPASPIILHYAIAILGMKKFLTELKELVQEEYQIVESYFENIFSSNNIQKTIDMIKNIFYYKLEPSLSREFLIDIYNKNVKSAGYSSQDMHLSKNQIEKLLEMGHKIGTHSHSHISLARQGIDEEYIKNELIEPKNYLEGLLDIKINCMSYPFGEPRDCFSAQELFKKTNTYQLAFTIKHQLNKTKTSPLEIGRYMVTSQDDAEGLNKKIGLKNL